MTQQIPAFMRSRSALAILLAAGGLTLAACGDKADNRTAGQKLDSAVTNTEVAAADAKAKAGQMTSEAKAQTDAAAASTGATVKQEADEAKESVKDAGAAVASSVDDATTTATISAGLAKDPDLSAIKIDVDTKGGTVTLTGPAPNAAAKARAEDIAKSVKGVVAVNNRLEVKM